MTARRTLRQAPSRPELDALIERARHRVMTTAGLREQRISFAFGNTSIENPRITREMVESLHDEMYGRAK